MGNAKALLVAVIVVAVCAAGILALYQWPEPKAREGGLALLTAVGRARRLYAKALSMLTTSAFKVPEDKKAASAEDVVLREEMALNEGALGVLKKAEDELAEVLRKNPDAEEQARALAHATMGRIVSLRAKYHAEMAAKAWQGARDERNKAYDLAVGMGSLGVKARYLSRLAALTTDALEAEFAEAKKLQQDLQGQIQTIDDEIKDLEKTRASLRATNTKLAQEVEQLNTASQLATSATEGLEKFLEAQKIEVKITENRLEIDKKENLIRDRKSKRADLAIQRKSAEARARLLVDEKPPRLWTCAMHPKVRVPKQGTCPQCQMPLTPVRGLIQNRKKLKAEHEAKLADAKGKLAKISGQIEGEAEEALKACREAAKECKKALDLYEQAEKSLGRSVALQPGRPPQRKAEALAAQGDLRMAWAQLHARRLADHRENDLCVQDLEKAWVDATDLAAGAPGSNTPVTLPKALGQLRGFLKQPGQVYGAAETKYDDAIKVYKEAMNLSQKRLRWAYQGQLARAYLRRYHLSDKKDRASLGEARKLLQDAVRDQEGSRFLKPLVEELNSLSKG